MIARKYLILAYLFYITEASFAAQIIEVEPDGETEAFIAAEELSRIKIVGERIRAVRLNDGEVEVVEDTKLGEIFIAPRVEKPINLFLITEQNSTVKLLLVPKRTPSEQVFIKIIDGKKVPPKPDTNHDVLTLIKAMNKGADLKGFIRLSINKTLVIADYEFEQLEEYIGKGIKGYVLEVEEDFSLPEEIQCMAHSYSSTDSEGIKKLLIVMEVQNG